MLMINFSDSKFEAGVDEAGRGSLAGPITAAAVILPRDYRNDALDDSKRLSEKKRIELKGIIERDSIDFAVFSVAAWTTTKKAVPRALFLLQQIPTGRKQPSSQAGNCSRSEPDMRERNAHCLRRRSPALSGMT